MPTKNKRTRCFKCDSRRVLSKMIGIRGESKKLGYPIARTVFLCHDCSKLVMAGLQKFFNSKNI